MSDLSVIIPFRAADEFRLSNLRKVVGFLKTHLADAELLIVEQAAGSALKEQLWLPAENQYLYADDGAFNKSKLFNIAVQRVQGSVLLMCDADIIIRPECLHRSIDAVRKELHFVRPFENLIDLDRAQTKTFIEQDTLPTELNPVEQSNRQQFGEQLCLAGGVFIIRKNTYTQVGGFDERFLGWGGEDNAFSDLVQQNVAKAAVLKGGTAWHLWHPREDINQSANYQNNCKLLTDLTLARRRLARNSHSDDLPTEQSE